MSVHGKPRLLQAIDDTECLKEEDLDTFNAHLEGCRMLHLCSLMWPQIWHSSKFPCVQSILCNSKKILHTSHGAGVIAAARKKLRAHKELKVRQVSVRIAHDQQSHETHSLG